jgi:hypothetical protein
MPERLEWITTRDQQSKRRSALVNFPASEPGVDKWLSTYLAPPPDLVVKQRDDGSGWLVSPSPLSTPQALRYTLDGSLPLPMSAPLPDPLAIEQTSVLRVRNFPFGRLPSATYTRLLLVSVEHHLPVVSLVTEPANLWHETAGLYTAWENPRSVIGQRKASLEYVGALQFEGDLELHGGFSRNLARKSFRIRFPTSATAGVELGNALTARTDAAERVVVLRGGGNNIRWRLLDELFNAVYADTELLNVAPETRLVSPHHPVNLYLNGSYWGIYNLRERIDDAFMQRHVGPGKYDLIKLDLIERNGVWGPTPVAVSGDTESWRLLMETVRGGNASDPVHFARLEAQIDMDGLIDYWLFEVYGANQDWPMHNVYAYRRRDGDEHRWRWIVWDADQTFGLNEPHWAGKQFVDPDVDTLKRTTTLRQLLEAPDPFEGDAGGTLLIHHLLENRDFRQRFVIRALDLLNVALREDRIEPKLLALLDEVGPDRTKDLARWQTAPELFAEVLQRVRGFLSTRPGHLRDHLSQRFNLGDPVPLTVQIQPAEAGSVQVNTVSPKRFPWEGVYLQGVSVRLEARSGPGYRFAGWKVDGSPELSEAVLTLPLQGAQRVVASFEKRAP